MPEGRYRAILRLSEMYSAEPYVLRDSMVAWLAILSFTTFIADTLMPKSWGWWGMTANPVAVILGAIIALAFLAVAILAFVSLVILVVKALFRRRIIVNGKTPSNVLAATEPIHTSKGELLKQLRLEIRERDKLIDRYMELIKEGKGE